MYIIHSYIHIVLKEHLQSDHHEVDRSSIASQTDANGGGIVDSPSVLSEGPTTQEVDATHTTTIRWRSGVQRDSQQDVESHESHETNQWILYDANADPQVAESVKLLTNHLEPLKQESVGPGACGQKDPIQVELQHDGNQVSDHGEAQARLEWCESGMYASFL